MKQLFSDSLDKEYAGGVNAAAEGVAEEISMTNKQIEHLGMTFSESSLISDNKSKMIVKSESTSIVMILIGKCYLIFTLT